MMEIKFNVLNRLNNDIQSMIEAKTLEVIRKGHFVMGPEVEAFEKEFADYVGTQYCVGLANGLDALWIGIKMLGIGEGDDVLVQSNTYIATVMGITMNKANPIFVEPNIFHNFDDTALEAYVTPRTKAILVTHLYGQATKMDNLQAFCKDKGLYLIEDCAQSHGAHFNDQMTGSIGDLGCFSFYPSKNLGCFGDGGAIVTNNHSLAQLIRTYRNYGSHKRYHNDVIGTNSRLDEMQAAILRIKLNHLNSYTMERKALAERYLNGISNPLIELPKVDLNCEHVWHLFVIKTKYRDRLMEYLEENNIQALIHYPIPPHLQKGYSELGHTLGDFPIAEQLSQEVLSLPLYAGMTIEEIDYVISIVNSFEV